jgi:hypothetical protein
MHAVERSVSTMQLCLRDLAELTGGELRLAAMPPRDGEFSIVRQLVLSAELAGEGDVYWCLGRRDCAAELAFLRGALGVVTADWRIEPWPGRFCLLVDDSIEALKRLVDTLSHCKLGMNWRPLAGAFPANQESVGEPPELKGLQLCAGWGVDIYSPTCGQSANEHTVRRCRRRAA